MVFSSSITSKTVFGNKRIHYGTFTNASTSDTGGDVDTGLRSCEQMFTQRVSSAMVSAFDVVNETFPVDGSAVTVISSFGNPGVVNWMAFGS